MYVAESCLRFDIFRCREVRRIATDIELVPPLVNPNVVHQHCRRENQIRVVNVAESL